MTCYVAVVVIVVIARGTRPLVWICRRICQLHYCVCCVRRSTFREQTRRAGSQTSNTTPNALVQALKANDISADVQRHLVKVYALLAMGVAVAGAGAWAGIDSPMMST